MEINQTKTNAFDSFIKELLQSVEQKNNDEVKLKK